MSDSTEATLKHIERVQDLCEELITATREQCLKHDQSKLEEPEKSAFDLYTERLKTCAYGSDLYKKYLDEMKPILEHHYKNNSHHPEHTGCKRCLKCNTYYSSKFTTCKKCHTGLEIYPHMGGMTLLDLLEMFCDWKAATERTKQGSLEESLKINKERFELDNQLASILENTRKKLNW